jgi:hypothetical protein
MNQPWRAGHSLLVGAALVSGLGCLGEPTGETGVVDPAAPTPAPAAPPLGMPVAGFEVPRTGVKLLAFSIRLDRIAAATGLPLTDPAYATLRENRLLLGDHDYANAKPPQESWSAARLVTWVESVRPICQTPAVLAKFSPLPAKLPSLIEAAYGRAALAEETAALGEASSGLTLPPAKLVETTCLSVLSSLEFVAQ